MEIGTFRCKNGTLLRLKLPTTLPSRVSYLGRSNFFFENSQKSAQNEPTSLFIAAFSTLFDATRYLGKMKEKKTEKTENISNISWHNFQENTL